MGYWDEYFEEKDNWYFSGGEWHEVPNTWDGDMLEDLNKTARNEIAYGSIPYCEEYHNSNFHIENAFYDPELELFIFETSCATDDIKNKEVI